LITRAFAMGPWRGFPGSTNGGRWEKIFAVNRLKVADRRHAAAVALLRNY
jgi:hypothetical protein